ncbi:MAG: hypothetical protein QM730_13995 [Anaerolineales bacterium]
MNPEPNSCYFEIGNDVPILNIDKVQSGLQEFQPPYETINVANAFFPIHRQVEIQVSGKDDVSPNLKMGCKLFKGKKELDNSIFSCPSDVHAATQLGANGVPITINGTLSAGDYQLQLWMEDEDSGISDISVLHIHVPLPQYIFLGILGIVVITGFGFWRRISHRKQASKEDTMRRRSTSSPPP